MITTQGQQLPLANNANLTTQLNRQATTTAPKPEITHESSKPVNGHFAESARVIEGARLVESAKVEEGARVVASSKFEERAGLIESPYVAEGARLVEAPKRNGTAAKESQNNHSSRGVAELFERVYTERLVYKAIAERDPNCQSLFEALKKNEQICSGITAAFDRVYQRLDGNEDLLTALQSLPSLTGRN